MHEGLRQTVRQPRPALGSPSVVAMSRESFPMMKTILFLAAACAALAALSAPSMAADPGFCAEYARQAVHEVDVSTSIPGCFKGFNARCSRNCDRHSGWCLGVSYA